MGLSIKRFDPTRASDQHLVKVKEDKPKAEEPAKIKIVRFQEDTKPMPEEVPLPEVEKKVTISGVW